MSKGTVLLVGLLAGVLLSDKIKGYLGGGNTAKPMPRKTYPAQQSPNVMGLGTRWDCTQQEWLRNNISRYNNPFG